MVEKENKWCWTEAFKIDCGSSWHCFSLTDNADEACPTLALDGQDREVLRNVNQEDTNGVLPVSKFHEMKDQVNYFIRCKSLQLNFVRVLGVVSVGGLHISTLMLGFHSIRVQLVLIRPLVFILVCCLMVTFSHKWGSPGKGMFWNVSLSIGLLKKILPDVLFKSWRTKCRHRNVWY